MFHLITFYFKICASFMDFSSSMKLTVDKKKIDISFPIAGGYKHDLVFCHIHVQPRYMKKFKPLCIGIISLIWYPHKPKDFI